jgi:nucleotide-binding universal stress UspA family protein
MTGTGAKPNLVQAMNEGERMRKIVVGFDGGRESRDALHLGSELAQILDADILLACALGPDVEFDVWATTHFAKVFDQAKRELPGRNFGVRGLRDVSAPAGLADVAAEEQAALIVIGSTHRGSLGRVIPGGVGERLLARSPCPVAVAPHGFADHEHLGLGMVGVAVDGSRESDVAVDLAGDLAALLDAKLRVITIVPAVASDDYLKRTVLHDRGEEIQASAMAALPASLEVESALEDGNPPAVLARHGVDLDLLVIGSRGYGALGRMLVGGVSTEVMRSAPCPVLVVPQAALASHDPACLAGRGHPW